jgi:hypothetical protein
MKKTFLSLCLMLLLSASAYANNRGLAVMELFTSTGCPACPAADELAKQMDDRYADVLVLSCHVTFFDRRIEGAKLSKKFCDTRQKNYHSAKVIKQTYTPQVIINGQFDAVGNNRKNVLTALRNGGPLPRIGITRHQDSIDIELPGIASPGSADVWLITYTARQSDPTLANSVNVVTDITRIMSWNGQRTKTAFPVSDANSSYAVIVQNAISREVIAAGR